MYVVDDLVSVFVNKQDGEHIASLVDNGTRILMHIVFGRTHPSPAGSVNRTSVLFVSISFIVLMVISLAWLIFYYIQRFRYAHTKDRLAVSFVCNCYRRHCNCTHCELAVSAFAVLFFYSFCFIYTHRYIFMYVHRMIVYSVSRKRFHCTLASNFAEC